MAIEEIHPQWVKVNDQIHRVSDFSHLPPASRPDAVCPLCLNPVIMKLGDERVHHYAHKHDVMCTATQPETALHLNTKFHIYNQLLSGTQLYLEQYCSNGCGKNIVLSWAKDWEKIEIEYTIGKFRPDVFILARSATNKAIEIKVTHPVENDKEEFYKEQNIDWLEIEANESIYDGENPWTIDQPLPFAVCKTFLPAWTCDHCIVQLRDEELARRKAQEKSEYHQHNYLETIYAKMVDFYYPSGKQYREIYYMSKRIRNDKPTGIFVKSEKEGLVRLDGEIDTALIEKAFLETQVKIDERSSRCRAFIDTYEWLPWVYGKKYYRWDTERYPFRYGWDQEHKKWELLNEIR